MGLPQRSSLGPILWLLVMNDVFELPLPNNSRIQAFADDLVVLIQEPAAYRFQIKGTQILADLNTWGQSKNLEFNEAKSNYILIHIGTKILRRPTIKLKGKNIKYTEEIKYLGLLLDEKMTWQKHLNAVKDRVIKLQFKLARVSKAT